MSATRESSYASVIRISRAYCRNFDVRHVEAYMRAERPTLDGMSWRDFDREVCLAQRCIEEGGVEAAEELAQSFGLGTSPSYRNGAET